MVAQSTASFPLPAASCPPALPSPRHTGRDTPAHPTHQGQSQGSAATPQVRGLSQHAGGSLGARSRHLLFSLSCSKVAWELLAKRWHRKMGKRIGSWGSVSWTDILSYHGKIDRGASKLSLFSHAVWTMIISNFLSNNWFYLQNPIAAVLLKDFIKIVQDPDDLEAEVCRTSVKGKEATLLPLLEAFRFFCTHTEI